MLEPQKRKVLHVDFFTLNYLHTPNLPDQVLGIHSPNLQQTYLIEPIQWGNIWVYGMRIVFTGFIYVAGHFSAELKNLQTLVESDWLPRITRVFYYILPNFRNFDVKARVVAGDPVPATLLGHSTAYAGVYIVLLLIIASVVFGRRNLK